MDSSFQNHQSSQGEAAAEGDRFLERPFSKELEDHKDSVTFAKVYSRPGNGADQTYLRIPLETAFRTSMESIGHQSVFSSDPATASQFSPSGITMKLKTFWADHKGVFLMILAQMFGSTMAVIARLMENGNDEIIPMSPFQILFARQSITSLFSFLYMWLAKVPEAPLGPRNVRKLLVLRGFGGFFGVFGFYSSLMYLPLADAIVLTFLAPMLAAWVGSLVMKTPFTRREQFAGIISIFGVVLITQPLSLSSAITGQSTGQADNQTTALSTNGTSTETLDDQTRVGTGRALGVFFGFVGMCGAACAYVSISWIGKQAHPLISVNYFAVWCTVISTLVLVFVPGIDFRMPDTLKEWILLTGLGVTGFIMQFLLTESLSHKRSNAVLNVVYVQMLFAIALDKIVFHENPGILSLVGSALILGSVLWVALKNEDKTQDPVNRPVSTHGTDEEAGLVQGMETNNDDTEPNMIGHDRPRADGVEMEELRR
jgi:drug/metabolite transporter (DMT)-like permease